MATYFQAINDNGFIHIDDNTARFHKSRQGLISDCGTLSYNNTFEPGGLNVSAHIQYVAVYDIPLESNEEFMTIKVNFNINESVGVYCCRWTTTAYRVYIYSAKYSGVTATDATILSGITCYFWSNGSGSNDRYGLQIFNASGTQIFHSSDYMMDILSAYSYTGTPTNTFNCYNAVNTGITTEKSLLITTMPCMYVKAYISGDIMQRSVMGLYAKDGTYWIKGFWNGGLLSSRWYEVTSGRQTNTFQAYVVDI